MNNQLSFPVSPWLGLFTVTSDTGKHKLFLSIIFLFSSCLLISALRRSENPGSRERQLTPVAGLLGLLYVGLSLCWRYVEHLPSPWLATTYYFGWHLLGGISVAVLLYIVHPNRTKIVLVVCGVLLVAFNVFAIFYYTPTHHGSALHFFLLGNSLFIGVWISSGVLLGLE